MNDNSEMFVTLITFSSLNAKKRELYTVTENILSYGSGNWTMDCKLKKTVNYLNGVLKKSRTGLQIFDSKK
jgi:hypothetical protein